MKKTACDRRTCKACVPRACADENKSMGKQRGKTTKAGENREKEQMWVHWGKSLIHTDKLLLRAGVRSQQYSESVFNTLYIEIK